MSKHEYSNVRVPIENDNNSITRDDDKCVLCGACKSVCKFSQGVYGFYDLEKTNDNAICIDCGQCTLVCPTNAITEVMDYHHVKEAIKDPDKIVIFQTSPSIRVAVGELFGMEPGTLVEGAIVTSLKKLGADYVFDTTFGADLTIMEEATELVKRITNNDMLPQFTSCCPAWVKFVEMFLPEYINNLSSAKSPISMQGAIIKTYFAKLAGIDPKKIVNVAVTPCTAKKTEIKRSEMNDSSNYNNDETLRDMDYIITTRELAMWLKEENIDFNSLEESNYDDIMARGSGAGLIFGNSGGVMEAAIRTAYYLITHNNPPADLLNFTPVRGINNVKEASIDIGGKLIKIAVINGTFHARKFIKNMEETNTHYDFIEVMSCHGGCIAGGGTPKTNIPLTDTIREARINALYKTDITAKNRYSHENSDIIKLYETFLGQPNTELAHKLLHTTYNNKSDMLSTEDKVVS